MNAAIGNLSQRYDAVRKRSLDICDPLAIEDYQVQPMDDASPPKWHLAHVTWFFETFLLTPYLPGYVPYNPAFEVLFNSYYNGVGVQYPRPKRGHLSRPTVEDVLGYRRHVDEKMQVLLAGERTAEIEFRVVLGLNHEQQHQELMFTDLKYNLGNNPLFPAYRDQPQERDETLGAKTVPEKTVHAKTVAAKTWTGIEGGIHQIGVNPTSAFSFDNESPRHEVLLQDVEIADHLVTNEEYLAFIADDGYRRPELWLSDAWSQLQGPEGFSAPLYWNQFDGAWHEYTLGGLQPLDPAAPVCHVSGYEADAFARWSGARLPRESELELLAAERPVTGNFVESGRLHPAPAPDDDGPCQVFGDVWEWTQSSYGPYPGFSPFSGQLGEYNGKFMANQLVLRGGSCVTPTSHMRPSYRNFFYPGDRWQFSGIRLARD